MFYDEPDMAAYAERARLKAEPGSRWSYSSASIHILARIVRDKVGGSASAVQRFALKPRGLMPHAHCLQWNRRQHLPLRNLAHL